MHADEIDVTTVLVGRLVAEQFPQWAGLPIRPVSSTGTVNAIFRLGDDMSVRLPRVAWGAGDVAAESRLLSQLAPYLPVAIPRPVAEGRPNDEYPWTWLVVDWLPGVNPVPGRLPAADALAADLAEFVRAFRKVDLPDPPTAYRGGPLTALDAPTRAAIAELRGTIDTDAAAAVWQAALDADPWDGPPTWVHADLLPGNLLIADGRLSGVIDFATAGAGDPACDLIVAWNLLPAGARDVFRAAVGADDAMWTRGRGRALSMSLIMLPYYKDSAPDIAALARHTIDEILGEN
jgi:aminoglycoside phosphotransferase (APT) family kinase protein